MTKLEEINDPRSCLNRAADDELVFVLRASDPAATVAVAAWMEARIALGENRPGDAKLQEAGHWLHNARR
jgi:hypothetical protein